MRRVHSLHALCNFIGATSESQKSDSCTKMLLEWSQTLLRRMEGLAHQTRPQYTLIIASQSVSIRQPHSQRGPEGDCAHRPYCEQVCGRTIWLLSGTCQTSGCRKLGVWFMCVGNVERLQQREGEVVMRLNAQHYHCMVVDWLDKGKESKKEDLYDPIICDATLTRQRGSRINNKLSAGHFGLIGLCHCVQNWDTAVWDKCLIARVTVCVWPMRTNQWPKVDHDHLCLSAAERVYKDTGRHSILDPPHTHST